MVESASHWSFVQSISRHEHLEEKDIDVRLIKPTRKGSNSQASGPLGAGLTLPEVSTEYFDT